MSSYVRSVLTPVSTVALSVNSILRYCYEIPQVVGLDSIRHEYFYDRQSNNPSLEVVICSLLKLTLTTNHTSNHEDGR